MPSGAVNVRPTVRRSTGSRGRSGTSCRHFVDRTRRGRSLSSDAAFPRTPSADSSASTWPISSSISRTPAGSFAGHHTPAPPMGRR